MISSHFWERKLLFSFFFILWIKIIKIINHGVSQSLHGVKQCSSADTLCKSVFKF
jgi:hypothetical protein